MCVNVKASRGSTGKHLSRGYGSGANSGIDHDMLSAGERMDTTAGDSDSKPSHMLRDNFVWSKIGPEKYRDVTPHELVEWLIGQ